MKINKIICVVLSAIVLTGCGNRTKVNLEQGLSNIEAEESNSFKKVDEAVGINKEAGATYAENDERLSHMTGTIIDYKVIYNSAYQYQKYGEIEISREYYMVLSERESKKGHLISITEDDYLNTVKNDSVEISYVSSTNECVSLRVIE